MARESIEKLNIEEQKEAEELEILREDFVDWAEQQIEDKDNSPETMSQLKIIKENEKKIPAEDFKLFLMYNMKEENFDWEEYQPLAKKILKELEKEDNNTRRVFFKFFSKKLEPRLAKKGLKEERDKDN